jgi:hypothetical protein
MIRMFWQNFDPHIIETYQTKEWANTITMGPPATVYLMKANEQTSKLLQHHANGLYDWIAPKLPEDLLLSKIRSPGFHPPPMRNLVVFPFGLIITGN